MAATLLGKTWNDDQALARVREVVDPLSIHNDRIVFEQEMLRNIAFYCGKQHFVQDGSWLRDPVRSRHRVYYKANMIVGAVNRAASMIAGLNATFRCVPAGPSRTQRQRAKMSERLFAHLRETTDYRKKKLLAYLWAANTGSAFLKTTWDPNAGEPYRFYLDDAGELALDGLSPEQVMERERAGKFEDLPSGDVRLDLVNGFQAYWDWDAREQGIDECEWFAQVIYVSREKLYNRFGDKALSVKAEDGRGESFYFQEILAFMGTGLPGTGLTRRAAEREREVVRLVEYWERPSRQNKGKGRRIVVAGDTVMKNGENPYAFSRVRSLHLPFVKVDWWTAPGRFPGLSMTGQLTSPQFQYNRGRATQIELQNVYGHPAMFVPKGSGIPTGNYVIDPGAVYEYSPLAGKIEHGPTPTLPKEILQNVELSRGDHNLIAANADPDSSKLPAQLRSGEAIRFMLEEKSRVLSPTAIMSQAVDVLVGRNVLELARHFYTDQRKLDYIADDGEYQIEYFTGADLNTDLRVVSDPDMSFSPTAVRADLLDLVQIGTFNLPPEVQVDVLKGMHFGTTEEFMRRRLRGELSQEREIARMIQNPKAWIDLGGYPVTPWEPHAEHARVLVDFFQSGEFEALPPDVQAILQQHWQGHAQALALAQEQQLAMMERVKGTPGQKGQASQPRG